MLGGQGAASTLAAGMAVSGCTAVEILTDQHCTDHTSMTCTGDID